MANEALPQENETYQAGACSCTSCKAACSRVPGWFAPEQIAPLAAALGVTEQELFAQHLQIDWWESLDEPVFVLAPRLNDGDGGTMYPGDPRGHGCHWYVDGKCSIHEIGKPAECQMYHHDEAKNLSKDTGRPESVVMKWKSHQQRIRDLYGAEPEKQPYSFLDFLGLGYGT